MSRVAWITAALLPLTSCSSQAGWQDEVLVRLFKAGDFTATRVTVQASQGAQTKQQTLDSPFDDCARNRLRIVPRSEQGVFSPLTVRVSVDGDPVAPVSKAIDLPAVGPVAIIVGQGDSLEPAGCLPADAGVPDGGEGDGGVKRAIGEPCEGPQQCAGGLCLDRFTANDVDISMPGGYCSRDCAASTCGGDSRCVSETDGLGSTLSKRCLRTCKLARDCGRDASYHCTTDSLCLP